MCRGRLGNRCPHREETQEAQAQLQLQLELSSSFQNGPSLSVRILGVAQTEYRRHSFVPSTMMMMSQLAQRGALTTSVAAGSQPPLLPPSGYMIQGTCGSFL